MSEQIDKERRTTLKIIGTTGLATAGVIGMSGSAVAQNPTITTSGGGGTLQSGEVRNYRAVEGTQRQLPNLQELNVTFTNWDETTNTLSGTVEAVSRGQGGGATRDTDNFDIGLDDVAIDNEVATTQNGDRVEILRLNIQDLFLNLLGLEVTLDLFLLIEAVEGQGLLGDLLVALLGSQNGGQPLPSIEQLNHNFS